MTHTNSLRNFVGSHAGFLAIWCGLSPINKPVYSWGWRILRVWRLTDVIVTRLCVGVGACTTQLGIEKVEQVVDHNAKYHARCLLRTFLSTSKKGGFLLSRLKLMLFLLHFLWKVDFDFQLYKQSTLQKLKWFWTSIFFEEKIQIWLQQILNSYVGLCGLWDHSDAHQLTTLYVMPYISDRSYMSRQMYNELSLIILPGASKSSMICDQPPSYDT